VAPAVLATRLPVAVAVAAYAAVAAQLWVHLRRIGTFGPVVALLYPLPLLLFLVVFARSLALLVLRRRVRWKGRAVAVG
jgi:4,4'-diaponeurosporenoate glycosyltransferase